MDKSNLEPAVDTNKLVSELPKSDQRLASVLLAYARASKRVTAAEILNIFDGATGLLKTLKTEEDAAMRAMVLNVCTGMEAKAAMAMPLEVAVSIVSCVEQSKMVDADRVIDLFNSDVLVSHIEPRLVWQLVVRKREWIKDDGRNPSDRSFMTFILERVLAETIFADPPLAVVQAITLDAFTEKMAPLNYRAFVIAYAKAIPLAGFSPTKTAAAVPAFDAYAFLQAMPPKALTMLLPLPAFKPVINLLEEYLDWGPDVVTELMSEAPPEDLPPVPTPPPPPPPPPAEEDRPTGMAARTEDSVAQGRKVRPDKSPVPKDLEAIAAEESGGLGLDELALLVPPADGNRANPEPTAETEGEGPVFPPPAKKS